MKASELRIGNKALLADSIVTIEEICSDGIETPEHGFVSANKLSGIPLTEEWLVKFGFAKSTTWFRKGSHAIELTVCNLYEFKNIAVVEVKYVHQLQNLYFALTGEELTIIN